MRCQMAAGFDRSYTPYMYGTPALATKITHLVRLLHSLQVVLREVGRGGGCRLCKREEEQWGWWVTRLVAGG